MVVLFFFALYRSGCVYGLLVSLVPNQYISFFADRKKKEFIVYLGSVSYYSVSIAYHI